MVRALKVDFVIIFCLLLTILSGSAFGLVIENKTITSTGSTYLYGFGANFNDEIQFNLTNNTGVTWTDYHFWTLTGGEGGFGEYSGPGTASFTDIFKSGIDVIGLNVANNAIYTFSLHGYGPTGEFLPGGVSINGYPSFEDNGGGNGEVPPVPEPSTLILFGAGLAGIVIMRKKMKK